MTFTRALLTTVHAEVRARFPSIRPMRDAWVHQSFNQWEFHGPDGFYAHFRAEDGYHARAEGWEQWLEEQGNEGAGAIG